jgi:Mannosylglycerate hydrolase MGH1-like glycoside hydrolase domain
MSAERDRLDKDGAAWKLWGPYLSERAWGTVREDYSANGTAWDYFPHDHARSRVYRWNEDGLGGICDASQYLCFALALWNGRDPILKERLFGLTGNEGNHGEDVKDYYFYLDSTPTHSYMRMLYKYPQAEFPYRWLVEENRRRGRMDAEFELIDTGIFAGDRYFDVVVEYAKAGPEDVLIRITAANRGPDLATLHLLPTLWFRNTWSWGYDDRRPTLTAVPPDAGRAVQAHHHALGDYVLACENADDLLFTDNETNAERLFGSANQTPYVKDAFHARVVGGTRAAVNPERRGTKAAAWYERAIAAGGSAVIRLRLGRHPASGQPAGAPFVDFDARFAQRQREADEFFPQVQPAGMDEDWRRIQRQAIAGLMWSKQFFHYNVQQWLDGDPAQPPPPPERKSGRNHAWRHLNNAEVISMPDKWEYPWYAAWDLGFHCISLAMIDAEFAKQQLVLLGREWYQHPNGQVPAYEWAFGDVNPPVYAWAAWRVYEIDRKQRGRGDAAFLERVFHKMLLNFTWWVNRKDAEDNNVFEGGFLGLDNVGVFDRSAPLPTGGFIEQSDGTSWMGVFSLNLMTIALELARTNPVYEDIATKFFEHFLYIAGAMNDMGGDGIALWDDHDEFFYDVLRHPDGHRERLTLRSIVGLTPLFAVETIEPETLAHVPNFKLRLEWFLQHRPQLAQLVSHWGTPGAGERRLIALVRGHRMKCLLARMLDPNEFFSDYGVRSVSRIHEAQPYVFRSGNTAYEVRYEPAESRSGVFGGNSNWRGPIWLQMNYLLIEALQKFYYYYGDDFTVECPVGSGEHLTLGEVADEISQRLIRIFTRDANGRRPVFGGQQTFQNDPHWRDHLLFYEYFHGDNGAGLGASHQTGWTGLVAKLIHQQSEQKTS